ncbi:MAG: hypothetical protein KGK07_14735 [Chloroflexota bacterium]|nr:hypothetical protein [Chloroflexota bacterium]
MKTAPEPNPKAREQYLTHTATCAACAAVDRKARGAARCAAGRSLALDVVYSEPILRARAAQVEGGGR